MNEPMDLTVEECRELLRGGVVGRIALSTPVGPRIVPVNYSVYDDAIVFRTSPYSELGTHGPGREAAFEIDHLDYEHHQGWSVVAFGRLETMDPEEVDELVRIRDPRPWAGGSRHHYLRLTWRDISGRRIGNDWTRSSMMPVRLSM